MLQAGDGMGAAGRVRGVCVRKVGRGEGFFVLFFYFSNEIFTKCRDTVAGRPKKKKISAVGSFALALNLNKK